MRAGLLSDPKVIRQLNDGFVNTSIIIDDLEKRAASGDQFAKDLAAQWEYPVEMMLLKPDRTLVSKLNSYKDFPGVQADVAAPPGKAYHVRQDEQSNSDIFLKHLAVHFGKGIESE